MTRQVRILSTISLKLRIILKSENLKFSVSDFQLLWAFPLGGLCITYALPCDSTGIDNEWRKTQCMPREVCIDVGKEFGAATNTFFKPPCVSVYRCGGCCNSEGQQCMNTSTSYLSKTVGVSALPWGSLRQNPYPGESFA